MKSRISHVLIAFGALLAFAPILAVDYLLDAYVRVRETSVIQQRMSQVTLEINTAVNDALVSLRSVVADSPSLCTPTFTSVAQSAIESSLNLKQMLVENLDGVQYCDAYGRTVREIALSEALPIPGRTETISIVQFADMTTPVVKVSTIIGGTRRVSAYVPLLGRGDSAMAAGLSVGTGLRVSLTNNTTISVLGDDTGFRAPAGPDYMVVQAYAAEIPIKAEYVVPFATVRAGYAEFDTIFTLLACALSVILLLAALRYARKSRVQSFDLERAIGRNEIKPYYQPVINLRTGALMGCEVLCRWEKPNGQVIPPGVFIDYAEQTGLAIPMTLSLMQQVRHDLGPLTEKVPGMKISINLFEGHFRDVGIVDDVQAIFGNSQISFEQLVFEITERRPLENSVAVNSVISGLHALGSKLAMDDTGTGHSNLAYLATLGVDVIKIDRIFVDMIKPGTTQVPVLDGLISMAKDLDCEVVAEGVETEEQAIYLRSRGVISAQGYIFAPALKFGAFRDLAVALQIADEDRIETDKPSSHRAA